ncbi:helix-turn-helix transcriptional regulator [Candidatus Woesearchaeota archaeon]|nr:helix-turn-helix transcriptional regulator [Candidatus Woesearchaeota archaeon]
MAKSKLLFIDLSQKKTKSIAEAITSETARKVMDHLSDKVDTEQQIATTLGLPISTVHYHIQKLMEVGLVKADEFHYSAKGREVNHYKLASQYIVIAPSRDTVFRERLKALLPVGGIVVGIAAILRLIERIAVSQPVLTTPDIAAKSAELTQEAVMAAPTLMMEVAPVVQTTSVDFSLWFLVGGLSAMVIYVLVAFIQDKIKRK